MSNIDFTSFLSLDDKESLFNNIVLQNKVILYRDGFNYDACTLFGITLGAHILDSSDETILTLLTHEKHNEKLILTIKEVFEFFSDNDIFCLWKRRKNNFKEKALWFLCDLIHKTSFKNFIFKIEPPFVVVHHIRAGELYRKAGFYTCGTVGVDEASRTPHFLQQSVRKIK